MASIAAGVAVTKIFTTAPLLGFVPVAAHFKLFDILVESDKPVAGEDVLAAYKNSLPDGDSAGPVPGLLLIQDTLHAMAGLGLVDAPAENLYSANTLTRHLVAQPSALHGGLHFSIENLLAAAFLFPKLKAENFEYPFRECETPMQYAHKLMGNEAFAKKHTYEIMSDQCRMDSFNTFMTGKFFDVESNPDRLKKLGYDIGAVLEGAPATVTKMVDIGGGRGEMLLQFKETFPQLQAEDLVVEEFNDDLGDVSGVTLVRWNYKEESSPQPIKGALIYHLQHVVHNLPDLDAVRLLQKIGEAMAPHSRILVHEMSKSVDIAFLHAAMMLMFGGKERTPEEFRKLAAAAGLKVTFEAFQPLGDGVIEMMKL
ncbi:S-adenosyl-L-methionine-dependent methyltransferase [Aspergillus aurantiobrunneus]